MSWIKEEDLKEVRSRADIVDIIGHYLPLEKKGKDYRCLCPFHDDHDPSMTINTQKQIFKCFVCGQGGNVFSETDADKLQIMRKGSFIFNFFSHD